MTLLIKKFVLSGIISLLMSSTTYTKNNGSGFTNFTTTTPTYQPFDLGDWSLDNSTSIPEHTCDSATHTHDFLVTHHEGYDTYVGTCTNNETKNFTSEEANIYHDHLTSSNLESPSHTINNYDSTTSSHDHGRWKDEHLRDQVRDTHNEQANNTQTTLGSIPLDSDLILAKDNVIYDPRSALSLPIIAEHIGRVSNFYTYKTHLNSRFQSELAFVKALRSGKVLHLLNQIYDSNLPTAKAAFNELKQLWIRERKHMFLVHNSYNNRELNFIVKLGIDVMSNAEITLVTRPDYIAEHTNEQSLKVIQAHKDYCTQLQQKGNRSAILNEIRKLQSNVKKRSDFATKVSLAIATKTFFDPVTTVLHGIAHAPSLEKALSELLNLEIQILDQTQKISIIHTDQIKQWTINHYGFDVLDAAQKCYKSRADYIATSENQSLFSDTMRTVVNNIEHKDLPSAYAELVHLDKQIDKILDERNIIGPIAQKEYIKKSFGKDVLELAHKTYEARADHKQLVESFIAIDVNQAAITILENNNTYESVANEMNDLAKHVFVNAYHCNLSFLPHIEPHVYSSIDSMRTAKDLPTFIFNISIVGHTLSDIQQLTQAMVTGKSTLWEGSPGLFMRAIKQFGHSINPVTQAKSIGNLIYDAGWLLLHPTYTGQKIYNITTRGCDFLINSAKFTVDTTIGKYYLSRLEREDRIDTYSEYINILPSEHLAELTAENYVDFAAQAIADWVFLGGIIRGYTYLKKIDALGKISKPIGTVAKAFKKGIDTHLTDNPIIVIAEGITIRMSNDLKNVGEKIKNSSLGQSIILRVNNMKEFFDLPFGQKLHPHSLKTSYQYQNFSIYKLTENIPNTDLKKGYFYYLDRLHGDHIEVFNKQLKAIGVYNLDGTFNMAKSEAAQRAGRTIKLT